jgi:hypothetical protein
MIVGFGIIGGILYYKATKDPKYLNTAYGCWIFGAIAGLLGLSKTKIALPVYWAWMAIAFVMGNIMSRILVALFYYLMITPIGLIMRLTGRDKLQLKAKGKDSYWLDIKPVTDKDGYERQF